MRALSRATLLLLAAVSVLAHAEDEVAQAKRLFDQYVALSAARQIPMIQAHATNGRLLFLRGLGGITMGGNGEDTTRSPDCRCGHGRPSGRSSGIWRRRAA